MPRGGPGRVLLTLVVLAGLMLSLTHLLLLAVPPRERPVLPPRAALAGEIELFEAEVETGSPLSVQTFGTVEGTCRDPADTADPAITGACTLFEQGIRPWNRDEIERAVHLLRTVDPATAPGGPAAAGGG